MQQSHYILAAALAACAFGSAHNSNIRSNMADHFPETQGTVSARKFDYPKARKGELVEDLHGVKVADPYRWLEDAGTPETRTWIEAENKLTFDYLRRLPLRERVEQRLTKLIDYEKVETPWKEGDHYFFSRNTGLQNQSVLYVTESLKKEPRVLLDPNTLSKDGTVALGGLSVSDDGKLLAYSVATAGSDWQEWKVRDVETGKDLPDHIRWAKFSGASWTKDRRGFVYGAYDAPKASESFLSVKNSDRKVYYHRLGTPQSEDILVFNDPTKPDWFPNASVTDDGRYLVLVTSPTNLNRNAIYYADLKDPQDPVSALKNLDLQPLLTALDGQYSFIDNDGPIFWFITDKDAPRRKVIAVDIRNPKPANWKMIVPEGADSLQGVNAIGSRFLATYLKDAHTVIREFALDGRPLGEVEMPGIGSAGGFSGRRKDQETFYSFSGYTTPPTLYRYDLKARKSSLYKRPQVAFDPDAYETKQIFYTSKDGTRVPMFITHKKGIPLDGSNPTLLYGYGGFNASMTPSFAASRVAWMEMGGVYAVANLRGGGEYGREWHLAGTKLRKQNVFDDFIAAAEWLIASKYTSPKKLAIQGGSNGGLLVGAVMNQRPELFGAALPAVGVMDMLRFHKFTIGANWIRDYGSPDDAAEFKALYAYSPLHNLKSGTKYPPTLVTTSDHDDRVVPAHSFKYAAALQAAQGGDAPVLIRIETKAGHGAGKPISKQIEEMADVYAFLAAALGIEAPSSFGR